MPCEHMLAHMPSLFGLIWKQNKVAAGWDPMTDCSGCICVICVTFRLASIGIVVAQRSSCLRDIRGGHKIQSNMHFSHWIRNIILKLWFCSWDQRHGFNKGHDVRYWLFLWNQLCVWDLSAHALVSHPSCFSASSLLLKVLFVISLSTFRLPPVPLWLLVPGKSSTFFHICFL